MGLVQRTELWKFGDSGPSHKSFATNVCDFLHSVKMHLKFLSSCMDNKADREMIVMKEEVDTHSFLEIGCIAHHFCHMGNSQFWHEAEGDSQFWGRQIKRP